MTARTRRWLLLGLLTAAFVALLSDTALWEAFLKALFPGQIEVLHPRAPLIVLVWEHVRLVAISSAFTVLIGVPLGVWVTRPGGRDLQPIVSSITSFGQTFPPVAVLALAVPSLGFGLPPTVVALFLYGLLPVVRNTIAGLNAVPPDALDAACGMGMSRFQALLRIEAPLAGRAIIAGIRTSVVINIGTAMIGAVIGAGGLGSPIVAGLVQFNMAFVLEGAIPAALLAILADQLLSNVEKEFAYAPGQAPARV